MDRPPPPPASFQRPSQVEDHLAAIRKMLAFLTFLAVLTVAIGFAYVASLD